MSPWEDVHSFFSIRKEKHMGPRNMDSNPRKGRLLEDTDDFSPAGRPFSSGTCPTVSTQGDLPL